jgi:hypothetical protein
MMPLGAAEVIAQISPIFQKRTAAERRQYILLLKPLPSYKATNADLALAKIIQGLI